MNHAVRFLSILFFVLASMEAYAQVDWQHLGTPLGGNIFYFAPAPNGDVYVGTEWTGMYRSTDNGDGAWLPFGPASGGGYAVLVTREGTVMAVSDDRGGVFRLTDDGATVERANSGVESVFPGFMAQTQSGAIIMATQEGVYRSTDDGRSWGPTELTAGRFHFPSIAPDGSIYLASNSDGLFSSTDDGVHWISTGALIDTTINALYHISATELLAGTDVGVFKSIDGGRTFSPFALDGLEIKLFGIHPLPSGGYVVAAEGGLRRVSSSGAMSLLLNAPVDDLYASFVTKSGSILLGYEGRGILRSTDDGLSFGLVGVPFGVRISGLWNGPVGNVFVASREGGLFRFRNTSPGFQYSGMYDMRVEHIASIASDVFVAVGANADVRRSIDDGATWAVVDAPTGFGFTDAVVMPSRTLLLSSYGGIARSTDSGATWSQPYRGQIINALARTPEGELWGISSKNLFHSSDDGVTWDSTTLAWPTQGVTTFSSIHAFGNGVMLLVGRKASRDFFLRTSDNGASWDSLGLGCNDYTMSVTSTTTGDLFATTTCGIYRSVDTGATWRLWGKLPENELDGIMLGDQLGNAWFGGRRGVYVDNGVLSIDEQEDHSLGISLEVHPNPATRSTTLDYSLHASGTVTIDIVDALGRTVMSIAPKRRDAGRHSEVIPIESLPTGVYLMKLDVDGEVVTRKLVKKE